MHNYYLSYTTINSDGSFTKSPRLLFLTEEKANAYLDLVAEDSVILYTSLEITDREVLM